MLIISTILGIVYGMAAIEHPDLMDGISSILVYWGFLQILVEFIAGHRRECDVL